VKREYLALLAQEIEEQRLHLRELAKGKGKAKDVSMEGEEEEEETEGGMRGLWQYNETGCLEDLEEVDGAGEEGERDEVREAELALERLKEVLSGKVGYVVELALFLLYLSPSSLKRTNEAHPRLCSLVAYSPKMVHTPYFKVTLSTVPLPELARRKGIRYVELELFLLSCLRSSSSRAGLTSFARLIGCRITAPSTSLLPLVRTGPNLKQGGKGKLWPKLPSSLSRIRSSSPLRRVRTRHRQQSGVEHRTGQWRWLEEQERELERRREEQEEGRRAKGNASLMELLLE